MEKEEIADKEILARNCIRKLEKTAKTDATIQEKEKAEEGKQDQLQKPLPLSAETCELFIAAANQMSLLECQSTS